MMKTTSTEKLRRMILEELKRCSRDRELLNESGFQPRSSLKNFQRQRKGMMSNLMSGGPSRPTTPMEQDFGWNPPEVEKRDGKYQLAGSSNFTSGKSVITEDEAGVESSSEAQIVVNTSDAKSCGGAESHKGLWRTVEGKGWYFGKYPLNEREDEEVYSWRKIINELVDSGPKKPIEIHVWYNGEARLYESKYGVAAYDMLGIPQVPAHIKWFGGSGGTEKDELKEYYQRAFLPKNANSLEQYFDGIGGINFVSDKKRVNWVDGDSEIPNSPAEAYKTGNYEEGNI